MKEGEEGGFVGGKEFKMKKRLSLWYSFFLLSQNEDRRKCKWGMGRKEGEDEKE